MKNPQGEREWLLFPFALRILRQVKRAEECLEWVTEHYNTKDENEKRVPLHREHRLDELWSGDRRTAV